MTIPEPVREALTDLAKSLEWIDVRDYRQLGAEAVAVLLAHIATLTADNERLRDAFDDADEKASVHWYVEWVEAKRRAEKAEAERDDLLNQLGECFRMAGADPDGNENRRLARRALKAVTDLRRDYDENEDWKSRHDALAQRCAAAERGVQAARSLCESWHAEARAEGYGGGNTRAHLILAAIDAAIHQETP